MNMHITTKLAAMFREIEPNRVSQYGYETQWEARTNGPWCNALHIASRCEEWLVSDRDEACAAMREWARESGGWEHEEIAEWSHDACLALFAQIVASELREHLDFDKHRRYSVAARKYNATDWDKKSSFPRGNYYTSKRTSFVEWYAGI